MYAMITCRKFRSIRAGDWVVGCRLVSDGVLNCSEPMEGSRYGEVPEYYMCSASGWEVRGKITRAPHVPPLHWYRYHTSFHRYRTRYRILQFDTVFLPRLTRGSHAPFQRAGEGKEPMLYSAPAKSSTRAVPGLGSCLFLPRPFSLCPRSMKLVACCLNPRIPASGAIACAYIQLCTGNLIVMLTVRRWIYGAVLHQRSWFRSPLSALSS